jgi:hypothetical protein
MMYPSGVFIKRAVVAVVQLQPDQRIIKCIPGVINISKLRVQPPKNGMKTLTRVVLCHSLREDAPHCRYSGTQTTPSGISSNARVASSNCLSLAGILWHVLPPYLFPVQYLPPTRKAQSKSSRSRCRPKLAPLARCVPKIILNVHCPVLLQPKRLCLAQRSPGTIQSIDLIVPLKRYLPISNQRWSFHT